MGGRRLEPEPAMNTEAGLSMTEALVASAVLALGLSGALRLGGQALQLGTETREQLQARQLAQNLLECHALPWPDCGLAPESTVNGTVYRAELERQPHPTLPLDRLQVSVRWQGVLPAPGLGPGLLGEAASSEMKLQLWLDVARVPRWVGVSSP